MAGHNRGVLVYDHQVHTCMVGKEMVVSVLAVRFVPRRALFQRAVTIVHVLRLPQSVLLTF